MAQTVWAISSGNASSGTTWNNGVVPSWGDNVYADGNAVIIDCDLTVLSLRTRQRSGGTAGGTFTCSGAYTISMSGGFYGGTPNGGLLITTPTGTITTIIGNTTGGVGTTCYGVLFSGAGILNFTGNSNGAGGDGLRVSGSGTLNFTGNYTGGVTGNGIRVTANATTNITGIGTSTTSAAFNCISTTANIDISGIVQIETGGTDNAIKNSGSNMTFSGIAYSSNGIMAIYSPVLKLKSASSIAWYFVDENGNDVILGNSVGMPVEADVRELIIFGAASEFTGTFKVAPPSSVAKNVPTDNTVGTLEMTPADFWSYATRTLTSGGGGITAADVWDHLLTAIATPGSIGDLIKTNLDGQISDIPVNVVAEFNISLVDVAVRMRNCSTVNITGSQIATIN